MRTMDKFSWIPFAVVIVGTLRLLLVEQPSPSDVNLIFWLVTLGLFGLPFFVIISSFFRYPNRRFFEFAGSLISWAIGVGIFVYELSTDRNFYAYGWLYFALVQLFLLTLGTALKLQVLISR